MQMLRRKAYASIEVWHNLYASKPLLVTGVRQVCKTYLIE